MSFDFSSHLPSQCPEKLKKSLLACSNSSEILDVLLKVLCDTSNPGTDPQQEAAIDFLQNAVFDLNIQFSEAEFAILSLQNVFLARTFEDGTRSKILTAIVMVMLSQEQKNELTSTVLDLLIGIAVDLEESTRIRETSIDCLIEIESNVPESLSAHVDWCIESLGGLVNKEAELLSIIATNLTKTEASHTKAIKHLVELIPNLDPVTMTIAARTIGNSGTVDEILTDLKETLQKLLEQYHSTSDLCVVQAITTLQVLINGSVTESNPIWKCSHNTALPVARNLMVLDWLAQYPLGVADTYLQTIEELIAPSPLDGADSRLKKLILIDGISSEQTEKLSRHIEDLMNYAIQSGTSRSMAAVFRFLSHAIISNSSNSNQTVVIDSSVAMATRCPSSLPHLLDFLKWIQKKWPLHELVGLLVTRIIDAFDDLEPSLMHDHLVPLLAFFTEASTMDYEFCQPRVVVNIVRKNLSATGTKNWWTVIPNALNVALAILDLCQTLIQHQDYEIFQPELSRLLSLLETWRSQTEIQHRAWMLRSLITHVNTDNLRDAFNVDMDLSKIGDIERSPQPLIAIDILHEPHPIETRSAHWPLEHKSSTPSLYFPLEIQIRANDFIDCADFFGIRITFNVDSNWGEIDPIYIPVLQVCQVKKCCLHIQPKVCIKAQICPRAVLSTTEGRIIWFPLEEIVLSLEDILSPLSAEAMKFYQIWDELSVHEQTCTSILKLDRYTSLKSAIIDGPLQKFQWPNESTYQLALVTPDIRLMLIEIRPGNSEFENIGHAKILVENQNLLSVAYSLLSKYTTNV